MKLKKLKKTLQGIDRDAMSVCVKGKPKKLFDLVSAPDKWNDRDIIDAFSEPDGSITLTVSKKKKKNKKKDVETSDDIKRLKGYIKSVANGELDKSLHHKEGKNKEDKNTRTNDNQNRNHSNDSNRNNNYNNRNRSNNRTDRQNNYNNQNQRRNNPQNTSNNHENSQSNNKDNIEKEE